jgi:hypothetical protein
MDTPHRLIDIVCVMVMVPKEGTGAAPCVSGERLASHRDTGSGHTKWIERGKTLVADLMAGVHPRFLGSALLQKRFMN